MPIKKSIFAIKGMTRDAAVSKFSPNLAYENKNLRLIATDDNTSYGLVNERGTDPATIANLDGNFIEGTPIGQEIINDTLVLFTTGNTKGRIVTINGVEEGETTIPDYTGTASINSDENTKDNIYTFKINGDGNLDGTLLYSGDLGFDSGCPIESIGVYENEQLQKVYWTDGINQPRVINIVANTNWTNDSFNFIRKLNLAETYNAVTISRDLVSSGSFAPGTIQYLLSYYNTYGQQSNIFYTSPLYYVSHSNRGAAENDTVGASFTITVSNVDTTYDYLRIYAIHRTSKNGTPQARKVVDISLANASNNGITYTDYGTEGETIDPTELLYIGGETITAGTLAQKDNTLFLGDIAITKEPLVNTSIASYVNNLTIHFNTKYISTGIISGYYSYDSQLKYNSSEITTFKLGEVYRFGLQFQNIYGRWSEPLWISDTEVQYDYPYLNTDRHQQFLRPYTTISDSIADSLIPALLQKDYVRVRPVVVYPTTTERKVVCQGVLCPTVYNVEDRFNKYPDVQSSWFFRPNAPYDESQFNVDKLSQSQIPSDTSEKAKVAVMSNYSKVFNGSTPIIVDTNKGKWAEFRHNEKIPGNSKENAEIQCITHPPKPFLNVYNEGHYESSDPNTWAAANKECYYVDQSIVTFHSPDIEFNKEIRSLDSSNLKLRIIGYIPIDASTSDIDIQTSTPPMNYVKSFDVDKNRKEFYPDIAPGFYKEKVSATYMSSYGWKSMLSGPFWLDDFYNSTVDNASKENVGFIVYPWHRNGSLNNTRTVSTSETKSAMLQKKKMSILRYSSRSLFFSTSNYWTPLEGISGVTIFDSDEDVVVKIPEPENSNIGELTYKGNIDKIITFHTVSKGRDLDSDLDIPSSGEGGVETTSSFYPIIAALSAGVAQENGANSESLNFRTSDAHSLFSKKYEKLKEIHLNGSTYQKDLRVGEEVQSCSNDPVSMKYKSTPHAVIALNYQKVMSSNNQVGVRQVVLPSVNGINRVDDSPATTIYYNKHLFWDPNYEDSQENICGVYQSNIQISNLNYGFLWLAELYNDDVQNRFGGTTNEAFENNQWIPAGPEVSLLDSNGDPKTSVTLYWTEGDTYYQRYDCLKTYPFTLEDQNSVVDILSFMCETRVNLDGRYDRNRGQNSNLYMNPANFNLLNTVYSQKNNFFTYRGTNPDKLIINNYPNTVVWSKTKTLGETVDTWTNVTLAATLDLDGDKGRIRAIRRYNNDLLAFQDRGLSQILYNESVQIASTTGVPIEIANSGKVSGKRYISNHIGCVNKWSICSAPTGIYFMDDLSKDIFMFNGQLNNISDKFGFHSWIISSFPNIKIWNPRDFNFGGEITYYDKINNDVMFITGETCLSLSEPLGAFSSFYSYENTPYFSVLKDRGILWHKDDSLVSTDDNYNKYRAWWYREGEYNNFFGVYHPFYTTVIANENPTEDKIFNNLEYRGDTFNTSGDYQYLNTFDHLVTWNEYQRGEAVLADNKDRPSTLKKKFRIWRANIPRNTTNQGGDETRKYTRDRMRNPWLYIKLSKETPNNFKTILHDLVVYYFD